MSNTNPAEHVSCAPATPVERPYWHMQLACGNCGASGLVPWDRLDRVLCCQRCGGWFRTSQGAGLVEIDPPKESVNVSVRRSFSEWQQHRVTIEESRRRRRRSMPLWRRAAEWLKETSWTLRSAAAGVAIAFVVLLIAVGWSGSPTQAAVEVPLPTSLSNRAPLFAKAWLKHDVATMIRLGSRSQERQIRRWIAATPPPTLAGAMDSASQTFDATINRRDKKFAQVAVRIGSLLAAPGSEFVQQQRWIEDGGTWYFDPILPPTPPRRRGK